MHWEVNFMEKEGVVNIRTSGILTDLSENQRMISDVLAEAEKHGVTKILIDDRDLTLKVDLVDIYYLPKEYDSYKSSRSYKVAIVFAVANNTNSENKFKFYETRVANMGYNHRLFTDLNAALDWLMS